MEGAIIELGTDSLRFTELAKLSHNWPMAILRSVDESLGLFVDIDVFAPHDLIKCSVRRGKVSSGILDGVERPSQVSVELEIWATGCPGSEDIEEINYVFANSSQACGPHKASEMDSSAVIDKDCRCRNSSVIDVLMC